MESNQILLIDDNSPYVVHRIQDSQIINLKMTPHKNTARDLNSYVILHSAVRSTQQRLAVAGLLQSRMTVEKIGGGCLRHNILAGLFSVQFCSIPISAGLNLPLPAPYKSTVTALHFNTLTQNLLRITPTLEKFLI